MFLAASFQAVFYWPPLVLVPGQGTRLSTAVLGGLSLAALFLTKAKSRIRVKPAEVLTCLALTGLGLASALLSSAPMTALLRTLTLLLPGLGGYWCARVLLTDPVRRKGFINLGLILLTGFTALRLVQHFTALPRGLEASCKHPTAGLIYILFFAPLALAATRKKSQALFGLALMISGWALSILMYLKTVMIVPLFPAMIALLKNASDRPTWGSCSLPWPGWPSSCPVSTPRPGSTRISNPSTTGPRPTPFPGTWPPNIPLGQRPAGPPVSNTWRAIGPYSRP